MATKSNRLTKRKPAKKAGKNKTAPAAVKMLAAVVPFDGRQFIVPQSGRLEMAAIFDLAYRARRGDVGAAASLDALAIGIRDIEAKSFWPIERAEGNGCSADANTTPSLTAETESPTLPALDTATAE